MNVNRDLLRRLLFLLVICGPGALQAQDIHFSQYFNNVLNKNPGLTGIFNGDQRITAHYRHQWYSVPVDYLTFSGAYDQKIYSKKNDDGFFSVGGLLNYDRAGDARLSLIQLGLSGSYTIILNKQHLITGGLQLNGARKGMAFSEDLTFDSQFQMGMFMDNNPTMEPLPIDDYAFLTFDLAGGINYRWQKSERTNIDIGGAIFNILRPNVSFYNREDANQNFEYAREKMPQRFTINLNSTFQLGRSVDLLVNGLVQFQDEFSEYVPAILGRFHINQKRGKEFKLDVGAISRLTRQEMDMIAPMIALSRDTWYVGLSYDVNVERVFGIEGSEFSIATERYGGPELVFKYLITKVKPLNNFKTCPIY